MRSEVSQNFPFTSSPEKKPVHPSAIVGAVGLKQTTINHMRCTFITPLKRGEVFIEPGDAPFDVCDHDANLRQKQNLSLDCLL